MIPKKDWFKYIEALSHLAVVIGVAVAIFQLRDLRNTNYGMVSLGVSRDIYSDKTFKSNPQIIRLLHEESPIIKDFGGSISDEDLNNFLGIFEWMQGARQVGILNDDIIYQMFSLDILSAYSNRDVRKFIQESRELAKDDQVFGGFDLLAQRMIEIEEAERAK